MHASTPDDVRVVRIEEMGFPRLFFALLHRRFTGTLQVKQPDPPGRRTVWILGGMPVHTDWVQTSETLGRLLLDDGVISGEQLFEALRSSVGQDTAPLGQILVEQGVIGDARLAAALQRQCFRKLVHLFELREGEVKISARAHDHGHDEERGQVNVLQLIMAGVSRYYDQGRIRAEMGEAAQQGFVPTDAFTRYAPQFRLSQADAPIVQALRRGASLEALAALPGIDNARACHLLHVLWTCQMVSPASAQQP